MAVRFPKYRPKNTEVIEFEDLNESFEIVINEASGRLNEHNFEQQLFSDPNDRLLYFTADCAYRIYQTDASSAVTLGINTDWDVLLEKDFQTIDSLSWILASVQVENAATICPLLLAIEINGQIAYESMIGYADSNGIKAGAQLPGGYCLDTVQTTATGTVNVRLLGKGASRTSTSEVGLRELIIINMVR